MANSSRACKEAGICWTVRSGLLRGAMESGNHPRQNLSAPDGAADTSPRREPWDRWPQNRPSPGGATDGLSIFCRPSGAYRPLRANPMAHAMGYDLSLLRS